MEVICISDVFPQDQLEHYRKHGVVVPTEGKIYTIREVILNTIGGKGVRLEEILNPDIPLMHPILGMINVEPNWAIRRFTNLLGEPLTEDMLREVSKDVNTPIINNIQTGHTVGAS